MLSLNDAAGPFAVLLEGVLVKRIAFGRRHGRLAVRSFGGGGLRVGSIVVAVRGWTSTRHVINSCVDAVRRRVADVTGVGAVSFKFGSELVLFLLAPFQIFFEFSDILPGRGRGRDGFARFDHLHDDVSLAAQAASRSEGIIDPIVLYGVRADASSGDKRAGNSSNP